MFILNDLNPKQREAATHKSGPILILAGAGSGKTRALTYRIAYLILKERVNPSSILAMTFTNKAANEMKERVRKLLLKEGINPSFFPLVGTFHSVCAKILRKEIRHLGYKSDFLIYDMLDALAVIKQAMKDLNIDANDFKPRAVLELISKAKNDMVTPEIYEDSSESYIQENVARVYFRYQLALKKNNALDFDDLLMKTIELFKEHMDILQKYQNKFKYIMVDEYQDTNFTQYSFVSLLALSHQNICVVGDDWQSIYSWRGATIRNILEFERDFKNAKIVKLEQNYRSTKNILTAAQELIDKNTNKKHKELWTANKDGDFVSIYEAQTEIDEARYIAHKISLLNGAKKQSLNNFVILYRTNAQSRILEEEFMSQGIPYRVVGSLRFYERKEIKDVLAYLRLCHNTSDDLSFKRAINEPIRGIGKKTFGSIEDFARKSNISMFSACAKIIQLLDEISESDDKENSSEDKNAGAKSIGKNANMQSIGKKIRASLENFSNLIKSFIKFSKKETVSSLIDFILEKSGYKNFVCDGTTEGEVRWQNIQELKSISAKFDDKKGILGLSSFLEQVSLVQDTDNYDRNADAVTFMTLHSAKGLEFDNVFIIGLEEGLFPHARSYLSHEEMEEERRLCYVGMTRAKQKLFLTYALSRTLFGNSSFNKPSRFLQFNKAKVHKNKPELFYPDKKNLPSGGGGILDKILSEGNVTYEEEID